MISLEGMIIAVEGPSAAGKTTLCRELADTFIAEYQPTGIEPDGKDSQVHAYYWANVDSTRWDSARVLESETGLAVCDSDPLKLHYSWCLARIGADSVERFELEKDLVREAVVEKRIGFADAVLVAYPDLETLTEHKTRDLTRQRRSFELHAQLTEPLHEWYTALEAVDPGHVYGWNADIHALPRRERRYDATLLDDLLSQLPAL